MDRFVSGPDAEVLVGRGLDLRPPERSDRERLAILTQQGAPAEVAERVRLATPELQSELVVLPDRDAAKDLDVVGVVYDRLADFNLGRHDTVVGVGGGALTDVAGFVAATWLRGVESVLVPTTLLGAVDASIGGKTGINRSGKNLVGAFWHPTQVKIDLDTLDALPPELVLEGAAEIVKVGLIADPTIVQEYAKSGIAAPLDVVVPKAVEVKSRIVRGDFREAAERTLLNFGHTIGHAVETQTSLAHGFAVSIGMVAAGAISNRRYGFDDAWLVSLLFSLGLPIAAAGISRDAAIELVQRDKKRTANGVRMVLLRAIGDPVVETVSLEEVSAALAAIGAD